MCHMSDMVGHGSGVGVPTSDWALPCLFFSNSRALSGRTTASAFQGRILLPGLCGGHSGLPMRLSPLRGLHSCALAVSVGLRSQLWGGEVMLPWRCVWAALLGANHGKVRRIVSLLCVTPGRLYKVCEVLLLFFPFYTLQWPYGWLIPESHLIIMSWNFSISKIRGKDQSILIQCAEMYQGYSDYTAHC